MRRRPLLLCLGSSCLYRLKQKPIFRPVGDFFIVLDKFIVNYYKKRKTEISASPVSLEITALYYYKFTTKFAVKYLKVLFFALHHKRCQKLLRDTARSRKRCNYNEKSP